MAFTEQGVAMLSSVLRSPRALKVNIAIMRTFVQLRRLMDSNRELASKIESLEKKYDEQFSAVQLSENEWKNLRYQIGTSSLGHRGRRRRTLMQRRRRFRLI